MAIIMEPVAPWLRELNRMFTGDTAPAAFMPAADVLVDEQGVTVYMDVPGMGADQLEIELEQDTLSVRGERPYPYGDSNGEGEGQTRVVRRIERSFGRFERSLRVPTGLNPDQVEASLADGVLKLYVPRPQPPEPKRISIEAGSGQAIEGQASQSQPTEAQQETPAS